MVGPEDAADHARVTYHNTIVGRYSNRLPVGTHTIAKNGATAEVSPLPNIAGAHVTS